MNPHYRYTPHHEPSLPSSSGPTTHYLAVSSSLPSSTNAVIICHRRHHCHHGVGCCMVPPAATVILTIVVHRRRNPTNDGVPAASPRTPPPPEIPLPPVAVAPSPPSRSPMAPSWTGMQRRHPPSWSDAASATPARASLVGIRAHCASATVILTIVVHRRRNPTNDGLLPASPRPSPPPAIPPPVAVAPSPPSRSPMLPSWTGMRRQCPPGLTRQVPLPHATPSA